ncbi:signal peptidase II [Nocardioides coralli]|uniref:signal peptidase II n=1 Tax=Nocardioides coralli TaxID=2872154 RepID=UPI001CA3FFE7|nr:signal peptidase II [Nocardioides coralli]QZY27949.1 signal peptidase II [Nocardioides coralli]
MQAARGASLSDADNPGQEAPQTPSPRLLGLFGVVAVVAYAVDLVTKQLAVTRLADGDVAVLGDWFVLHLTRNPGAAFSTGTNYTVALSCLAIAAVLVVLWFARRIGTPGWSLALGLLLGGVAGNLTDRLFREPGPLRGHVVDMFMLPHWPVFNVADICINVAAALILLQTFRGVALDGRPREEESAT